MDVPTGSEETINEDAPPLNAAVPKTADPLLKVTISPLGGTPALVLTVAVKVIVPPLKARVVPWALPSAEDLAHGTDLRLIDERTVAFVPHGAAARKDAKGKPVSIVVISVDPMPLKAQALIEKMVPVLQAEGLGLMVDRLPSQERQAS